VQVAPRSTAAELQALEARVERQEGRLRAIEEWATSERLRNRGSSPPLVTGTYTALNDLPTLADIATAQSYYNGRERGTLESGASGTTQAEDDQPDAHPPSSLNHTHSVTGVDTLRLEAPIATLRSLVGTIDRRSSSATDPGNTQPWDPVTRGLLSMADARECVHT
jgi:hypothetical protein